MIDKEENEIKEKWYDNYDNNHDDGENYSDLEKSANEIFSSLVESCSDTVKRNNDRNNYYSSEDRDEGYYTSHDKLKNSAFNCIVQNIKATLAKVSGNMPKIAFSTDRSDQKTREKAQNIQNRVEKLMLYDDIKSHVVDATRQSLICRVGGVLILRTKKVVLKRTVYPVEMLMPENLLDQNPNEVFLRRDLDINKAQEEYDFKVEEIKEKFPDFNPSEKDSIYEELQKTSHTGTNSDYFSDNSCVVYEAWAVNSEKKLRHIAVINKRIVKDITYKDIDEMPFSWIRTENTRSFWGDSMYSQLVPIQKAIEYIFNRICKSTKHAGIPIISVFDGGSNEELSNEFGRVYKYRSPRDVPQVSTPAPFNPMYLDLLKYLMEYSFQRVGNSQLSASALKPHGLDSGKAIESFYDIETERHSTYFTSFSTFFIEIAKKYAKYAGLEDSNLSMNEEEDIEIKEFSVSFLGSRPDIKIARVKELGSLGLVDKKQMLKLLDNPDIEGMIEDEHLLESKAAREIIKKGLSTNLYVSEPVDPNIHPTKMIYEAKKQYLKAVIEGNESYQVYLNKIITNYSQAEEALKESQIKEQILLSNTVNAQNNPKV